MIGLIYCAGYGTRLLPLTIDIPKPMIKVGDKPVLERIVDHFNEHGIDKIIVNTHYLPYKIMDYFGDRLLYTYEPKLLGEEKTLKSLRKWLEGEWVCVATGDTLTDVNITAMYNLAKEKDKNVKFMEGDIWAGTSILHPKYFTGKETMAFESGAWWLDIGTHERLKQARALF